MAILQQLHQHCRNSIRALNPVYFALIMATGIIAVALGLLGFHTLSECLYKVNIVAYPVLFIVSVVRVSCFRSDFLRDLTDARIMFTFFTFVAGSNIMGNQFAEHGYTSLALALFVTASLVWVMLIYYTFARLTFSNTRPIGDVLNGGWLIAVVATQSIVILGTKLLASFGGDQTSTLLAMYALWGVGIVFYIVFITLILYRLFFERLEAADLIPPYWINMGATAICTLAGANLFQQAGHIAGLASLQPSMGAVSVILWAWCTWWIPLLVMFGIWRHLIRKVPFAYHPAYWSLVFPLGMYTSATFRLGAVMRIPLLRAIPPVMVWVAFGAWGLMMLGLIKGCVRSLTRQTACKSAQ